MELLKKAVVLLSIATISSIANATHFIDRIAKQKYMKSICIVIDTAPPDGWNEAIINAVDILNDEFGYNRNINFYTTGIPTSSCAIPQPTHSVYLSFKDYTDEKSQYDVWDAQASPVHWFWKTPGSIIKFDTGGIYSNLYKYWNTEEKTALVLHEIMHTIGFYHVNSYNGTKVSGTEGDPRPYSSITADRAVANHPNPIFSEYDKIAIRKIYPQ